MKDKEFSKLFETLKDLMGDYFAFEWGKDYRERKEEIQTELQNKIREVLESYIQPKSTKERVDSFIDRIEEVSKKHGVMFSERTRLYLEREISKTLDEDRKIKPRPLTGTGVMIFKDKKVLLGKRKGSHGEGEWAFPGGHLELGESFFEGVYKELEEETGVQIADLTFLSVANVTHYMEENSNKHYIHFGFSAFWVDGEPEVREPDKCEEWGWFSFDELPEPLFEMVKVMIDSYYRDIRFYDRDQAINVIQEFDIKDYLE